MRTVPFSQGEWRVSSDGDEVTTSVRGVLEGSKRVCRVGNALKPKEEVEANGRVIAAAPRMMRLLERLEGAWKAGRWAVEAASVAHEAGEILGGLRESR